MIRGAIAVAVLLLLACAAEAGAPSAPLRERLEAVTERGLPAGADFTVRAAVRPAAMRLGEAVTYRGWVVVPSGLTVRWARPEGGGAFSWSGLATRRARTFPGTKAGYGRSDTAWVESRLQCFTLGTVAVAGLAFRVAAGTPGAQPLEGRLPTVHLRVLPVVPATDTSAELKPVRGPLAAPWWERVPWRLVVLGALASIAIALLVLRLRKRGVTAAAAPAPAAVIRDPAARALAELEALRGLRLPEHGRFGEHAFHLTRILRRFLEATAGTPRPGDTTPELLLHLEAAPLERGDLDRVAGLLRLWDQVKFARVPSTAEEARRAEAAVEELARRRLAPPQAAAPEGKVA